MCVRVRASVVEVLLSLLGVQTADAYFSFAPADETPTPTRFIRNCDEVNLFDSLPKQNPFDEVSTDADFVFSFFRSSSGQSFLQCSFLDQSNIVLYEVFVCGGGKSYLCY